MAPRPPGWLLSGPRCRALHFDVATIGFGMSMVKRGRLFRSCYVIFTPGVRLHPMGVCLEMLEGVTEYLKSGGGRVALGRRLQYGTNIRLVLTAVYV